MMATLGSTLSKQSAINASERLLRGETMPFVFFTRPDDTPVAISTDKVLRFSPVPDPKTALGGPLKEGTRLQFTNGEHQDVKELVQEVAQRLNQGPA
jgi:hypothetical protein